MDDGWVEARAAWAGGEALPAVAERLGLPRSTLYQRAQAWRAEAMEPAGASPLPFDPWLEAQPAEELLALARKRAAHAVRAGRPAEASTWMRLADRLEVQARRERVAEIEAAQRRADQAASRPSPAPPIAQAPDKAGVFSDATGSLDSSESTESGPSQVAEAATPPPQPAQSDLARSALQRLRAARAARPVHGGRPPPGGGRR